MIGSPARRPLRRGPAVLALTGLLTAAAGGAWATWSMAPAGAVRPLTVVRAGLQAGGLTPGVPATVLVTVANLNDFPVRVKALTLTGLATTRAGCSPGSDLLIRNDAPLPALVVPGRAEAELAWAGVLVLRSDAANACQDAPFTFRVAMDAVSEEES